MSHIRKGLLKHFTNNITTINSNQFETYYIVTTFKIIKLRIIACNWQFLIYLKVHEYKKLSACGLKSLLRLLI